MCTRVWRQERPMDNKAAISDVRDSTYANTMVGLIITQDKSLCLKGGCMAGDDYCFVGWQ